MKPCIYNNGRNFTVKFNMMCDANLKESTFEKKTEYDSCSAEFEYKGKDACALDFTALQGLKKFMGFFEIPVGLAMIFAGAKFLLITLTFLSFFGFATVSFALAYNVGMIDIAGKPSTGILVGVFLFSVIGGAIFAYGSYKFLKSYAIPILAGFAGFMVGTMVLASFDIPNVAKTAVLAIMVGASIFVGKKFNKYIKTSGTAVIGSGIFLAGVNSFAGGMPNLFKANGA